MGIVCWNKDWFANGIKVNTMKEEPKKEKSGWDLLKGYMEKDDLYRLGFELGANRYKIGTLREFKQEEKKMKIIFNGMSNLERPIEKEYKKTTYETMEWIESLNLVVIDKVVVAVNNGNMIIRMESGKVFTHQVKSLIGADIETGLLYATLRLASKVKAVADKAKVEARKISVISGFRTATNANDFIKGIVTFDECRPLLINPVTKSLQALWTKQERLAREAIKAQCGTIDHSADCCNFYTGGCNCGARK